MNDSLRIRRLSWCAALVLLLSPPLAGEEFRELTNVAGKTIRAKILAVTADRVSVTLESGRNYEIPLDQLARADREALAAWRPTVAGLPADGVTAARVNEAVGQALFAESALWTADPGEVAARLGWPRESRTAIGESYRAYPADDYRFLGARPHSAALYGEEGRVTALSIVFANKGDSFAAAGSGEEHFLKGKPLPGGMEGVRALMAHDAGVIGETLSSLLGPPVKQRFGEGEARVEVDRWDWAGHAFLLSHVPDEYVSLAVQTVEVADNRGNTARVSDATVRERTRGFVERRENGDVVIGNIPMVDQGPKGYCVPATAERCMRFLGIPADMYLLAMAGETKAGGGTSVDVLLSNIGRDIKRKGRSFEVADGPLKMRDIVKSVDSGIPLMWAMFSTEAFNETATGRTEARQASWDSHKTSVAAAAANPSLSPDRSRGHVVIIMGYNEETGEIAFSDSWGERFAERWITLAEAEQVSQDRVYVIGL